MSKRSKKQRRNIIIGVISGIVVIVACFAIFGKHGKETPEVTTEIISRKTIVQTVTAVGKIQPETSVDVSSETSGEIISLNVHDGDTVKAGQLIARIKPDVVEAQLEQSQISSEEAKSNIPLQQSNLEKAQADYNRAKQLYDKKYISQEEFDVAKNALDAAKSSLNSSNLNYKLSQASYKQTAKTAAKTMIYAPLSGVVTSLSVEKGEKVVGTDMMAGTAMLTVSDLNVMNAEVEVDENDIVYVKIGDTASVELDAFTDKKFTGIVYEIGHSAVESSTGTQDEVTNFKVKIRILDKEALFRPGMSCNVEIKTETHSNVLAVPLQSVTEDESVTASAASTNSKESEIVESDANSSTASNSTPAVIVYIVKDNKVKKRTVKTGLSDKGYIEITEGVSAGEEVVSGSYFTIKKELADGMTIIKNNGGDSSKSKKS